MTPCIKLAFILLLLEVVDLLDELEPFSPSLFEFLWLLGVSSLFTSSFFLIPFSWIGPKLGL